MPLQTKHRPLEVLSKVVFVLIKLLRHPDSNVRVDGVYLIWNDAFKCSRLKSNPTENLAQ